VNLALGLELYEVTKLPWVPIGAIGTAVPTEMSRVGATSADNVTRSQLLLSAGRGAAIDRYLLPAPGPQQQTRHTLLNIAFI